MTDMLKEHDFRRIALGLTDAIESAHMGHPDFRVNGRIFATLHHDRLAAGRGPMVGMVVLTPEQQQRFMRDHPASFTAESGAWGRSGCTRVQLDAVDEDTLGDAMTLAWQNTVQKLKAAKRPKTVKRKGVKN
jgi:hypothetical protein